MFFWEDIPYRCHNLTTAAEHPIPADPQIMHENGAQFGRTQVNFGAAMRTRGHTGTMDT